MASGPWSERVMPPAITSRLPPRSRNACSRASWAGLSESGVPATAIAFTSGAIVVSVSANVVTVWFAPSCSRSSSKLRRPRAAAASLISPNAILDRSGWVSARMSDVRRYSRSLVCWMKGMVLTASAYRTARPRYPSFTDSSPCPRTLNCTGGIPLERASRWAALSADGSWMTSFTLPRRAVVAQQVVHVALRGLDLLGQGAGREQLDGDEVRQRAQQLPGGRCERERPAGRQVDPAADVSAEQVHDDDAHGEQHGGQAEALKRLAACRELAGEQGEVREHEEQGRERHEVHGVAQVDHAAGDLAEMRQHAERAGDRAEAGRQSHEQLVQSHEDQQEHHEDADYERRDLVLTHARCPHADGGQACDEQRRPH